MARGLGWFLAFAPLLLVPSSRAADWTQPTPEELKMAADPAAPGAPAVYLFRDETTDDQRHMATLYARIKILTDRGVRDWSDVTIPYERNTDLINGFSENITGVEARTIHSDGAVIPFTGKPWTKELVKAGGLRIMEKGFSMPDVQIGSIIEYRYEFHYEGVLPPHWYIQQPLFVHKAHYNYVDDRYVDSGFLVRAEYESDLPPAAKIAASEMKGWDLTLENIPALADEDDSPPLHSLGYHVYFFYAYASTPDLFWQVFAQAWAKEVDKFCAPNKLKDAVAQIVAPSDSDEQKLRKIYAAVMQLENTDFTRERTRSENKAQKLKLKTAADIWAANRGTSDDLAFLFIGMARAAGLKAYAMMVTDRNRSVFLKSRMDWDQLDDVIAIVNIGGKEMYLDPGSRYCEFGKLHWKHTWTSGVRELDNGGAQIVTTPFPVYSDTTTLRNADLAMDADGQVHGTITVAMTGSAALYWRQQALRTDQEATKKEFSDTLLRDLPSTVTLNPETLSGLSDPAQVLVAKLDVSGSIGTKTGHRIFLPGTFFESQAKPRFAAEKRENPVYLPYSYTVQDHVKVMLPDGLTVENPPKDASLSIAPNADFATKYRAAGHLFQYARLERVANILYQVQDYSGLRDFFQKMNAQDQQQLATIAAPAPESGATASNQ